MKNKRGYIVFLLVLFLLLPLIGQAEQYYNIQQLREQAAKGWVKTYESNGRTVEVEAVPRLPEVEALPLLEVGRGTASIILPADDANWRINRSSHTDFLLDYKTREDEEPAGYAYIDGKRHTGEPYRTTYQKDYALDSALLPGNSLRFEEIVALMHKALSIAGLPDDTIDAAHPYYVSTHAYYDKTDTDFVSPGWGSFLWDVKVRGIPCHNPTLVPFKQGGNEPMMWTPHMSMVIRRPDLFWVGGRVILEKKELESDLPLLGFEQIVAGYEELIRHGKVRHVFDLSFGYALQPKPGMSNKEANSPQGIYYTKPFWRLECLWEADAKAPHHAAVSEGNGPYPDPRNSISRISLMMDAQTGEILNPASTKVDTKTGQVLISFQRHRAEYKGIKTWQDVRGK